MRVFDPHLSPGALVPAQAPHKRTSAMATGDALMVSVSGLRGTLGGSLTPATIAAYAGALAGDAHERATAIRKGKPRAGAHPSVVLARDGRAGSADVMELAGATLRLHGCDTVELDLAATPTVGLMVDALDADAGLMVTASHNPQNWCGLKPIVRATIKVKPSALSDASAPDKARASRLLERYRELMGPATPQTAHLASFDRVGVRRPEPGTAQDHARLVVEHLKSLRVLGVIQKAKFKLALDHVAGSGAPGMLALAKALGAKVHELYPASKFTPGRFPHTPEPTRENLGALCRGTRSAKAAIGLAQDPDADRLALVDERGSYIGEEYTLVLCALAYGQLGMLAKGDTLCVNLSTSRMIEDVAAGFGCRVVRTAVGEANVVSAMKLHDAPLGGEGNGGVIWPAVTYIRDSLGAAGLVLALMATTGQSLSALVASVPKYTILKRKVDLRPDLDPAKVLERVRRAYAKHTPDLTDGVWVGLAEQRAWLHVRASNTEPILRLIAEAPTQAQATALLDDAATHLG